MEPLWAGLKGGWRKGAAGGPKPYFSWNTCVPGMIHASASVIRLPSIPLLTYLPLPLLWALPSASCSDWTPDTSPIPCTLLGVRLFLSIVLGAGSGVGSFCCLITQLSANVHPSSWKTLRLNLESKTQPPTTPPCCHHLQITGPPFLSKTF